mgnify:CR=1 FL=1
MLGKQIALRPASARAQGDLSFRGGWLPLAFIGCLTLFEMMIAVLQAYIYTILTCVYLNDALHAH